MINLLKETIAQISNVDKTIEDIIAINIYKFNLETEEYEILLKTDKVNNKIFKNLDILYDNTYGTQEIEGIILFNDNSWLNREEYNSSEWWKYNKAPTINEVLTLDLI